MIGWAIMLLSEQWFTNFMAIVTNFLSLALLFATVYFLRKSITQVQHQLELVRREQSVYQLERFHDTWSRLDQILVEHPELTELWLDPKDLGPIKKKYSRPGKLREFFKRRAIAAYIIDIYFRQFKLGYEGLEEVRIMDNPEMRRMWTEGAIIDDYIIGHSDFVKFVETHWLKEKTKTDTRQKPR